MGDTISYPRTAALIDGLAVEMGSHFVMSVQKWQYPMSRQDMYAAGTFTRLMNVTRGEDDPHFVLDLPWEQEADLPDVSPEERAALTAELRASSAFGQLRNGDNDG